MIYNFRSVCVPTYKISNGRPREGTDSFLYYIKYCLKVWEERCSEIAHLCKFKFYRAYDVINPLVNTISVGSNSTCSDHERVILTCNNISCDCANILFTVPGSFKFAKYCLR